MGIALSTVTAVASAAGTVVSSVKGLVDLFRNETPEHPAVTDRGAGGAGLTKEQAIQEARRRFNLDTACKWNFAMIGQTKAGKSSLVNAFQGMKDNDPGAAKVGVTETTFEPQAFSVRGASNCFIWDLPGANTPNNPAETYFKDKLLCAFDGLLLVSGDTFLESDLEVLKQAQHYGIPVALVRTKSDMHIYNMVYSEAIEPEAAERKLRIEARSNMEKNVNRAGFGGWFPSLFVVSSRVMYRKVIGQAIGSMQEMDEGSTNNGLIGWIYTEAKKRTQKQCQ